MKDVVMTNQPMLATTEEKALLRVLFLREKACFGNPTEEGRKADLDELLKELAKIDRESGHCFGFSLYGGTRSKDVSWTVNNLVELDLVRFDPSNPHLTLTPKGRGFGMQLEFVQELEQILQHRWLCPEEDF
jgi:hypothetical protein